MITLKLKIADTPPELLDHLREYNKLKRCHYNLMKKQTLSRPDAVKYIESNYSYDTSKIDNFILRDCIGVSSEGLIESHRALGIDKFTFGSKFKWQQYHKELITKEEFIDARNLQPCLYSGRKREKGNSKFDLDIDNNTIIFKPKFGTKIHIPFITSNKRIAQLQQIQKLAEAKLIKYSITLCSEYIRVSVNVEAFSKVEENTPIKHRVAAFDANPNLIGFSILDFDGKPNNESTLIYKEVINVYELKHTHKSAKIKNELSILAKKMAKTCHHFKVELFTYEKLTMSGNAGKGKSFNRMVNNDWKRQYFTSALVKWMTIYKIQTQEVAAHYSSTIGCLLHYKETDCIAASMELARRGYIFYNRFIIKDIAFANVTVIYPPFVRENLKERWNSILEETKGKLGWVSLHKHIKKSKSISLRFLYQDFNFDSWISYRPAKGKSLVLHHVKMMMSASTI